MSGGRKSEYNQKYCEDMVEWFKDVTEWDACPTFQKYAVTIGFCSSTLRKWKNDFECFSAAYSKCKDIQLNIMFQGGLTGKFNSVFTIFSMKNMHNWIDKQELSQTISEIKIDKDDENL